ncbi:MAG: hypothetical protein ACW99E_21485, partial [Promethearchaeota archaeon]
MVSKIYNRENPKPINKDRVLNIFGEFFYAIYIKNPENKKNSIFNRDTKLDALRRIENYLRSVGLDPNDLGFEDHMLLDNYYQYMKIIADSLVYIEDGERKTIGSRSLDNIDARIYYKVQEYKFLKFLDEHFNIIYDPQNIQDLSKAELESVAFHLFHFRNIFRVKARNIMVEIDTAQILMREDPALTWKFVLTKNNEDFRLIIEKTMSGRGHVDSQLR